MIDYTLAHVIAMAGGTDHAAPIKPFTVFQAHIVMREHLECRAIHCPRKWAAFRTLTLEGRLVPATDNPR